MQPLSRFYTLVFTLSTALIFLVWGYIELFIVTYPLIGLPIGGLIALGTYRLFLKLLFALTSNIKFLKRIIFGNFK